MLAPLAEGVCVCVWVCVWVQHGSPSSAAVQGGERCDHRLSLRPPTGSCVCSGQSSDIKMLPSPAPPAPGERIPTDTRDGEEDEERSAVETTSFGLPRNAP
eukprot:TRINITY_DN71642_c0_g1_i1.p4 TRINITY_DN71642_c0_g1~~TRINITY_DN71642_c0_g1_i1.p4  ORF type:complete len:101 (+),score=13.10 TRINITY_DN71642_c0_g1_i1:152-454(+)